MNKEDRQAVKDMKWWREVADVVDCVVIGFNYRDLASFRQKDTGFVFQMPGFLAVRVMELYEGQAGG